jgi:DNA-binding PadR family transcriptional regulator
MSRIDCLVLASLEKRSLSLTGITNKIASSHIEKLPTRIGIHARLKKLNNQGFVIFDWQEGQKIYTITNQGLLEIKQFINQLMRLAA